MATPRQNQSSAVSHYDGMDTSLSASLISDHALAASVSIPAWSTPTLGAAPSSPNLEQAIRRSPSYCDWKTAVGIPQGPEISHSQGDDTKSTNEGDLDHSQFELSGLSMDAIIGSVMRMDTEPFPVVLPDTPSSSVRDQGQAELCSADPLTYEDALSELLVLATNLVANVKAYRASLDMDVESQRAILQCSMAASGQVLGVFQSIALQASVIASDTNLSIVDAPALLAQASSCYMLEASQWNVILTNILRNLKTSPTYSKKIARVIPTTRMEGLMFNTTLLQVRLFLQACMHTSQALCKQMNRIPEFLSGPGASLVDTEEVLKSVRAIHMAILNVFERLHT
ncbi:hypothetical protein DM02DRAFT_628432 [Periconia macrospinosa]|uniref:Aflatoxin regulatory protein domain-containing protein n=1 Tax=Periconia macrospinosa TaxID=97972 RepID=A0A2V1DQZ7_9PLEO|nr:hypothetical protein DM02DRAFT_628432 [Periconia macrospinosa]